MSVTQKTVISFDKRKYKSVKYNHETHNLSINDYVKFTYGPTEDPIFHKRIIGKVKQLYHNGIGVVTDFGQFNPAWHRIERIFVIKQNNRIKENRLKSTTTSASAGVLDNVMDKAIRKIKGKHPEFKIKDNRVDLQTRFSRTTTISNGKRNIVLAIDNNQSKYISITGNCTRCSKLNTKNDKIGAQQSYFLIKRICNKLLDK